MINRTLSLAVGLQVTRNFTNGSGIFLEWILITGFWNDTGEWLDNEVWDDGV